MTDQELRLVAEIIDRMHLNAAERQVEAVGRVRADSVTLSASYEQRIEALRQGLERKTQEAADALNKLAAERDGLLTQVQDLRAALAKEQELHAATALRLSTEAAKMVERKHPVKVGEWVKRTRFAHSEGTKINTIAQVVGLDQDGDYRVSVAGSEHCWCPSNCTPCNPPEATHDTPQGRSVTESVIRDDRKTEPKPGDTVRLVRVPTHTDLPAMLPWGNACGLPGDIATVETMALPDKQPIGVIPVRTEMGRCFYWPLSCIEFVRAEERKVTT